MQYQRSGNKLILRLDPGDEIVHSMLEIAEKEQIAAASISGIGATDDFEVGIFAIERRAYDRYAFRGNHEILNLCGNLSRMNGEAYQHMHITCAGSGGSVVGGHLLKAVISLTAEIVLDVIDTSLDRVHSETIGINRLEL